MIRNKSFRLVFGFALSVLGILLMGAAGYLTSARIGTATKGIAIAASAVSGGLLTFVVGRRLVVSAHD